MVISSAHAAATLYIYLSRPDLLRALVEELEASQRSEEEYDDDYDEDFVDMDDMPGLC